MNGCLMEVRPGDHYRLELIFRNGSTAVVNMEKRIHSIRFSKLKSPQLFRTARADGDQIVWSDGKEKISVYASEILDSMMINY